MMTPMRARRVVLTAVCGLLWLPAAGQSQALVQPCPVATLAPPQMEGIEQYVAVEQYRPCPPPNATRQDFTVTTDFGDGVIAETPFREDDPLWFIGGTHAYRRAGTYELMGSATDRRTGEQLTVGRTITIPNAPLFALARRRPIFVAGHRQRRTLARFHDDNRLAETTDYQTVIDWGDGSRSTATAVKVGGDFAVIGSHRYRSGGRRDISVSVRDDRGATLALAARALVRRASPRRRR